MSMFTLAISCLTPSDLPWFIDLTFQVPMQYSSLQHRTLLLSPFTFTTGCCFCFGHIPSFFLELFLHWSPVANWAPTDQGSPSFSVVSFFAFSYCSWGSQGKNTEVVCCSLLQGTTFCRTSPPWPVHLGRPHTAWLSFIELDKLWSVWLNWLVVCNYSCFFTCIQISQEAGKVVWYSQLYKNFPVCCDSHSQMLWPSQ